MLLRINNIRFHNTMFTMESVLPLSKASPNVLSSYFGILTETVIRQTVRFADLLLTTLLKIEQKQLMKLYKLIGVV